MKSIVSAHGIVKMVSKKDGVKKLILKALKRIVYTSLISHSLVFRTSLGGQPVHLLKAREKAL